MEHNSDKKRKSPANFSDQLEVSHELSSWIHSIYVVTFDIEFGQAIEYQFPPYTELQLTETEENNLCYSSFPDSNSSILGSTQFHFRMKLTNLDSRLKQSYTNYNSHTTQALRIDPQFINGYVHFLQRKDPSLKRGYFQKSLVILSMLPFVELFQHVVTVIGTNYFDNEQLLSLENVYNQTTKKWPTLQTGKVLNLTVMGSNIAFYIPKKDDKLNSLHANITSTSSSNKPLFSGAKMMSNANSKSKCLELIDPIATVTYPATTVHGTPLTLQSHHLEYNTILTAFDLDLYKYFYFVISDLQLLWEMILTCEPFIVIAHTPDVCASFVQAMTSLIYPFKYNADYRPFFNIHDPDFKEYVGLKNSRPNVILGVTNPFFTKCLEHWPNVVHLCSMKNSKSSDQLGSLISAFSSLATTQQGPSTSSSLQQSKIPFVDRLKFTSTEVLKPGLNTKYKPFLQKDRNFLTKILRSNKTHGNNRPNNIQTALIRRWLIELTQSFFMPLERYLTQLMPLHNEISPFKAPPELLGFDLESFLATLETSGPQLTIRVKGDWSGLYRKFCACPNFFSWYNERKTEIDTKLWNLHVESFLDLDIPQMLNSKDEVEVVDMVIFIQKRLANAVKKSKEHQISCESLDQFKLKLVELINTLPEDLRSFFLQRE